MSNLVDPMIRDNLDTNIIAHERNLIIMTTSQFPSRYVSIMDFINPIKDLNQFNI